IFFFQAEDGIRAGHVTGVQTCALPICRMFNRAIRGQCRLPTYLSSDHDPLYKFHQWQANLRILEVTEIKTVPYVPQSHPFVERRSEEHTSELQSRGHLVCRLLLEKKKI